MDNVPSPDVPNKGKFILGKFYVKPEYSTGESVEQLRERLNIMKKLMSEKQATKEANKEWAKVHQAGVIDGNFLSFAFGGALLVIITVSVYAFYNLYFAILKKFPSQHTEL